MKTETCEVSVTCELRIRGRFKDVKQLEEAVIKEVRRGACQLYGEACGIYQTRWLEHHAESYRGVCWRRIKQVTPFGLVEVGWRLRLLQIGGNNRVQFSSTM